MGLKSVQYGDTSGGVILAKSFGPSVTRERVQAHSRQQTDPFQEMFSDNLAIPPLFDPSTWANLSLFSTRASQLLRSYARNTGGLGWKIAPLIEASRNQNEWLKYMLERDMTTLNSFYSRPHLAIQSSRWEESPLSEILYQMVVDRESTGNGYLEVSRMKNGSGIPAGVWHIPSTTMRLLHDFKGFIQITQGRIKKVYFKNYNDPRIMDSRSGEFVEKGDIPEDCEATEILHFKLYSPISTSYGVPRLVSAYLAILGNKAAANRNFVFFENDAVPRMAVIASGGTFDKETMKRIEDFAAARSQGAGNAHRVMVLAPDPGKSVSNAKIEIKPLTVGTQDDASFTKYREANSKEEREAFGLSEMHLGSEGSANRAAAMTILRLINQQELNPAIATLEFIINNTISRDFGVKYAGLQLRRPRGTDILDDAKVLQRVMPGGAVTPKDLRRWTEGALNFDMPPFEQAWADIPFQLSQTLLRMKDPSGTLEPEETQTIVDELRSNPDHPPQSLPMGDNGEILTERDTLAMVEELAGVLEGRHDEVLGAIENSRQGR